MSADLSGGASEKSLRIVFLGFSIRSNWHNPRADTHRAVVQALIERGHDCLFLEERKNSSVIGQMKDKGAAAVFAFDEDFPHIRYRSYDPPVARETGVWLGLEASTADLMVLLIDAPAAIAAIFPRLQAPHLVRLHEAAQENGTQLVDTATGTLVTPYHPLPVSGAPSIARAIESARHAAGIRM